MAGTLAQVVRLVLDLLVTNVAEELFAITAGHLVLSALFWVDCVALRTFNTPLDVDVGVSLAPHKLSDHFLAN